MDVTAELLEDDTPGMGWRSAAIAVAPLVLLLGVLTLRADLILPEQVEQASPAYYPAVAVVFVSTLSEDREVTYNGFVAAERTASLRSEGVSTVVNTTVTSGDTVKQGQQLCTLRAENGETYTLFSPIDGTVSSVNGRRGTALADGQPCITVADTSSMLAHGDMPPRHAEIIRPGDDVTLTWAGNSMEADLRVVYPQTDRLGTEPRTFEVPLPEGSLPPGDASLTVRTKQVLPTHVPFKSLSLLPGKGMVARIVTGSGPIGMLQTVPVKIVATTEYGFFVEGLPKEVRLVINDPEFPLPHEGEIVRIGRVG